VHYSYEYFFSFRSFLLVSVLNKEFYYYSEKHLLQFIIKYFILTCKNKCIQEEDGVYVWIKITKQTILNRIEMTKLTE